MRAIDLTGARFDRLTVSGLEGNRGSKRAWRCRCDCGVEVVVAASNLRDGHTHSCGCLRKERAEEHRPDPTRHGHTVGRRRTAEYIAWQAIIARCTCPTDKRFPDYGGRGIAVCERWRADFAAFLADVGPRPSPAHSIDRIRNNEGYEPGNVRWATLREQANNTRSNHRITVNGETRTMSEWAERMGFSKHVIRGRLRLGWTPERAVTSPTKAQQSRAAGRVAETEGRS